MYPHTELIGAMRPALADALHLGRVQAVNLPAAVLLGYRHESARLTFTASLSRNHANSPSRRKLAS